MVDSGSAIQAETSKDVYIAAHVAKNPPNDVVSCVKLRAKIGVWRITGFVCVAVASKAMLASSTTKWSERDAYGGHDPRTTRLLRRLYPGLPRLIGPAVPNAAETLGRLSIRSFTRQVRQDSVT